MSYRTVDVSVVFPGGPFLPLAGGTMTGSIVWNGADLGEFLTSADAAGANTKGYYITTGTVTSGNGDAGSIAVVAGNGSGTGTGGQVFLVAGDGGATGGDATLGAGWGTVTGGNISLSSGGILDTGGNSGTVVVTSSNPGSATGNSGSVTISTANAATGNTGNIAITVGTVTVSGTRGSTTVSTNGFYVNNSSAAADGANVLFTMSSTFATTDMFLVRDNSTNERLTLGARTSNRTILLIGTGTSGAKAIAVGPAVQILSAVSGGADANISSLLTSGLTIQTTSQSSGNTSAAALTLTTGAGNGTGTGGNVVVSCGIGGASGANGAAITVTAGQGGAAAGAGGDLTLTAGLAGTGGGNGGAASLIGGAATVGGTGGLIAVTSGAGQGAGASGAVTVKSGTAGSTGNSGLTTLSTSNGGSASGASGNVAITTGNTTSGTTGSIVLTVGSPTAGTRGSITANALDSTWTLRQADAGTVGFTITHTTTYSTTSTLFHVQDANTFQRLRLFTIAADSTLLRVGDASTVASCDILTTALTGAIVIRSIPESGGITLRSLDRTSATTTGQTVTVLGGAGNTTGAGATVAITAGAGGNNGNGGPVTITSGAAGGGNNNGGNVTITLGALAGNGVNGSFVVSGGANYTLTAGTQPVETLINTDGGAGGGPDVVLYRNSASAAANDVMGRYMFDGNSATPTRRNMGIFQSVLVTATNGAEDAKMEWYNIAAGASNLAMWLSAGGLLNLDLDGGIGTAAYPVLFDDHDDVALLRSVHTVDLEARKEALEEFAALGLVTKKDSGSGYCLVVQPWLKLLAGAAYQNGDRISKLEAHLGLKGGQE